MENKIYYNGGIKEDRHGRELQMQKNKLLEYYSCKHEGKKRVLWNRSSQNLQDLCVATGILNEVDLGIIIINMFLLVLFIIIILREINLKLCLRIFKQSKIFLQHVSYFTKSAPHRENIIQLHSVCDKFFCSFPSFICSCLELHSWIKV